MFKSLLNIFLKSNCPLCKRSAEEILCSYCQRQIQRFQFEDSCKFWQRDLSLFVWGFYSGQLKRAIATFKYDGYTQLAQPLGYWLGQAWLDSPLHTKAKKLTVVPIPLHSQKLKDRGFNQAELIARYFCQLTGYSLQTKGLERIKETEALFDLNPLERKQQLNNALALGKDFQRRLPKTPVLILDDIYTTGTTTKEATKVLSQKGIEVFGVVAIATGKTSSLS